jgi:pyruvate kinase
MTGIIATLGPGSENEATITKLQKAGVDVFRLNFAHETAQTGKNTVAMIREVEKNIGKDIKILLDVEGPGIRTGVLTTPIPYVTGEKFKIFIKPDMSEDKSLSCDYPSLSEDVNI